MARHTCPAASTATSGAEVLAIDHDPHYLRQAAWVRRRFGIGKDRLRLDRMSVYDLARMPLRFDVVLFLGVLYHLRYPLLALDIVAQRVDGLLILETLTMPGSQVLRTPADLGLDERDAMRAPGWPATGGLRPAVARRPPRRLRRGPRQPGVSGGGGAPFPVSGTGALRHGCATGRREWTRLGATAARSRQTKISGRLRHRTRAVTLPPRGG